MSSHESFPSREQPEFALRLPFGTDIPFDSSMSIQGAVQKVENWMEREEQRASQVVADGKSSLDAETNRTFASSPRKIGERLVTMLRVLERQQVTKPEEMLVDGNPVRLEPEGKITFLQPSEAARLREKAVGAPVTEDGKILPLIEETRKGNVRALYVETRPDRLAA